MAPYHNSSHLELLTLSSTGTFGHGAFQVSKLAESNKIDSHPVGPNFDLSQFINGLEQYNPLVLQYEVLQAGLSRVGVNLPTVHDLQSKASDAVTNLGHQLGIPSKPPF
jgi:hypothetical protein